MRPRIQNRTRLRAVGVRGLLLVLAILLAGPIARAGLPHHENHTHKEIETLEEEWRQAQLNNNVTVIERLLADDYVGISATGTIETKTQVLAQHQAGTLHFTTLDLNDLKVRLYGDMAVVTSRAELQGTNGRRDVSGSYRYTRVYNRRLGQWKIVSFEASRIHDTTERADDKH